MGLALFKEKRLSIRRKLTGLMPGRLIFDATKIDVDGKPVDVSANGMGIVISKEIDPGTAMTLVLKGGHEVPLTVAWGQPDFGKQDMFRYGLVTVNPADNLEDIFVEAGCLR